MVERVTLMEREHAGRNVRQNLDCLSDEALGELFLTIQRGYSKAHHEGFFKTDDIPVINEGVKRLNNLLRVKNFNE